MLKEVRLLYRIAHDAKAQPLDAAIRKHCHWPSKQRYLQLALSRHNTQTLDQLYQRLFTLDKINKGMEMGDATCALQDILIMLSTAKTERTLTL